MRRFKFNNAIVIALAVLLLVAVPLAGCAKKPPPPPPPPPPAGTISVQPAKIDQAMLKPLLPLVAKAAGLPEAAAAALPPCLGILAIPVKFSGSGWPANELVTVDLVIPAGVQIKGGLAPGEDSIGIAFAKADAAGKFEATMEATAKLNWLINTDWLPTVKPDLSKIKPIPKGVYTIRAMGIDPRTVATITWELELLPAVAPPPAAPPPAAPPAAGKLSFEAAEYANAEHGFSVKYPKDWVKSTMCGPTSLLCVAKGMVPLLSVGVAGLDHPSAREVVIAGLQLAGGTDIKIVSERATTLADDTGVTEIVAKMKAQGLDADVFNLVAKRPTGWVVVSIATVGMLAPYNEALFSEIAHTLQFKK
ncbi:MAG: hypothetical protein FJ005_07050 [Chloroflexi bacterium]|nr:hypothetical protein [Chloroflexota bacterium]